MTGRFGDRTTFVYFNATPAVSTNTLIIEVLGDANGRPVRNQQGRVVHVTPAAAPGMSYTRYIDGGSGYMSQGAYAVTINSAYTGPHTIGVRLAQLVVQCTVMPPAYVFVREHGTPPCSTIPLPPAYPVPYGHEIHAVQQAIDLILE